MDISWTKYNTLQTCTLRYHLTYVSRVTGIPIPAQIYAVGAITHKVIEAWVNAGFPADYIAKNLPRFFADYTKRMKSLSKSRSDVMYQRALKASSVTARVYRLLGVPQHRHAVESKFKIPLTGSDYLIGSWDLLDIDSGSIWDIKTHSDSSVRLNDGQLELYALAASVQGHKVSRVGWITPLQDRKLSYREISNDAIIRRKDSIYSALARMNAGVTPVANPGSHCYGCKFNKRPECPATYTGLTPVSDTAIITQPVKKKKARKTEGVKPLKDRIKFNRRKKR